ncbi:12099_t:CDS:2, partial [Acaulospora morrowiae]
KELQRRLSQRVQQSPKQAVQERPGVPPQRKKLSPTQSKPSATAPQQKSNSGVRMQSHLGSRHDIGTDKMTPDLLKSGVNTPAGFASSSNSTRRAPVWSDSTQNASLDGSAVTEKTIEESYMVLRGNSDSTDDDDSDPFNKFWEIVESLVSKISNPVAFATVPLNGTDPQISFDPNTIHSPLPFGNNADGVNANKDSKTDELNTAMMESYYIIPNEQKANLGNSSYQRPSPSRLHSSYKKSESKNVPTKTLEEYAMENQQLKSTLDIISKRMQAYEKAAEENSMLRSSILQFKNDFQKQ